MSRKTDYDNLIAWLEGKAELATERAQVGCLDAFSDIYMIGRLIGIVEVLKQRVSLQGGEG